MVDILIVAVFVRLRAANIETMMLEAVGRQLRADPTVNVIEIRTNDDAVTITVDVFTIRNELHKALGC